MLTESTIIMNYLDESFPDPALRSADPLMRAKVSLWQKWADEKYLAALGSISYATGMRERILKMSDEERQAYYADIKDPHKRARRVDVIDNGIDGPFGRYSVKMLAQMISEMNTALTESGWLAGGDFSLADCSIIPFVARLSELDMSGFWEPYPAVDEWWRRIRGQQSFKRVFIETEDPAELARTQAAGRTAWPSIKPYAHPG